MCKYNEVSDTSDIVQVSKPLGPRSGPLASIGSNGHPTPPKLSEHAENVQALRKDLYKLRRQIGEHVSRVKPCGAYVQSTANGVTVAKNQQSVFYAGLQTCKSVWACPVCSMKIAHVRAEEVKHMLTNAIVRDGLHGSFVTLTIPHSVYENLKTLQKIVSDGFKRLTSHPDYIGRSKRGRFIPGIKQRFGVEGFIRALEVKKKNKGWHPHLHVVFVLEAQEPELLEEFGNQIINLWARIIKNSSGKVVNTEYGQVAKAITNIDGISDYLNKWDIGKELTQSHKKLAGDSFTPFELFQWYLKTGSEQHLNHFLHYVLSFHRVKQLTFSSDFKKKFMELEEKTDEQACTETEIETVLLAMNKRLWNELHGLKLEAEFLNLVQFDKDSAIDMLFHIWPDVGFSEEPGQSFPYFKLDEPE